MGPLATNLTTLIPDRIAAARRAGIVCQLQTSCAAATSLFDHVIGADKQRWVTWTDRVRDTVVLSVLSEEWLQTRDAGERLETFD